MAAAAAGELAGARELFAAVVHWCPLDAEARNALAMACHQLGDAEAARAHWAAVLARSPRDPMATAGLAASAG